MPAAAQPILYTLSGIVYDEFNSPLAAAPVKLFDIDLRSEQQLGQTKTDEKGFYKINFKAEATLPEYNAPDVQLRVYGASNKLLDQSTIYFNVQQQTTIDYKIGGTQNNGTNEFDLLIQKIEPVIKPSTIKLGELEENDKHKDISFIAGETGADAANISFLNTAFAFSKTTTTIAPDIFYGLFRMGFPAVLNELLLIKAASVKSALLQAMDENIISSKWKKGVDKIIIIFNALSVKKITDGVDEQSAAFKKLFGSLFPSKKQQDAFIGTYFDNEETPEIFWDKLKEQGFDDAAIKKTKQLLSLNQLTSNQPELAKHLFNKQATDPDLKEISGYAKFTKADWKQQITAAAVTAFPAWVKGNNEEEKKEHYAETLEQLHKQLYPTTFFAARMKQDGQSSFAIKNKLNSFFKENPTFELDTKNIHKQLAAAIFENATDKESVTKELKTINRLYKLTDDYKQVNELYSKQLFSSTDIVTKYGRQQFVKQFAITAGGEENAVKLYKKAVSINNKANALLTAFKMRHDIGIYAIDGNSRNNPEHAEFWKGYHETFNDGELCECEHCQSVYSPAAYFTDILNFIKREDENEDAFSELIRRRPDLDDIKLTCKNTNTPLPYIDLVNELLEKEVLRLSGIVDVNGVLLTNHSYQTEGIYAELSAMPEHSSSIAYDQLKIATGNDVFSPALPLDLPLEEIRIYAGKLGFKRSELMTAFYGNSGAGIHTDVNIAAEQLGFSSAELNIINGSSAFTVTLPVNDNGVCIIKTLLEKTKLSYIELLQLLETYFLNPVTEGERKIKIKQPGEDSGEEIPLTCNLDELFLFGANDQWLNKTVRFTRVWKKLGWDIFDLDRILKALKQEAVATEDWNIDNQLIISLANIENARQSLRISLKQAAALFNDIDTAIYLDHTKEGQPVSPSLYDELFNGTVASDAAAVCAAFNISAAEFEILEGSTDFTLQNLSRLYRNVLLARALGTSISDLKKVVSITGYENENGLWQPLQLCLFLQDWKVFRSLAIKADDFDSHFISSSIEEYTIPVGYDLIKQTGDCINDLTIIKNNAALKEDDRSLQCIEKVTDCLQSITNNAAFVNALIALNGPDAPVANPADTALKTVAKNYLGVSNKEIIQQLPAGEMIEKMQTFRKSLLEYTGVVLKKAPSIFQKLSYSTEETIWLKENTTALGIEMEAGNLFIPAKKLHWLSVLAKSKKVFWMDLPGIAIKNEAVAKAAWFEKSISLYALAESSLVFLCGSKEEVNDKGQFNLSFPEDYKNAENVLAILNCCKIIEKLGGNIDQLKALLSTTAVAEYAEAVKNLLQSKYGSKEWLDIIKPINDRLRTIRRDALLAWLLANTNSGLWQTSNDLYEWLLIDTEMDACMVTSRIKQGISSIQLFIDRCLMNLETTPDTGTEDADDTKKIILSEEFAEQWHSWRKQYRVWEANRKIFLYPENWIEPDLRDDKSPFFKELESELKQNEVTEDTAEEALISYLQKLDTVANLEMMGLFNDEETNIVHVFGRTHNIPHQYFYRKQQNNVWTAWQKVELDIEGDHILPVVWNGRLMLFWGMFTEKQDEKGGSTSIKKPDDDGTMNMNSTPAPKYLEMKLAWSENKNGKWGGKKISQKFISTKPFSLSFSRLEISDISMISYFDKGALKIKFYIQTDLFSPEELFRSLGRFTFDSCNAAPSRRQFVEYEDVYNWMIGDISTPAYKNWIIESSNVDTFSVNKQGLILRGGDTLSKRIPIFLNTPGTFNLTPFRHTTGILNFVPFFYKNQKHNLFVNAVQITKPAFTLSDSTIGLNFSRLNFSGSNKKNKHNPVFENPTSVIAIDNSDSMELSATNNNYTAPLSNFTYSLYSFYTFYHPFVCSYRKILAENGLDSLYKAHIQNPGGISIFTDTLYAPSRHVSGPYPKEEVDFSYQGSYSNYNWELFYHIPLLMATRLTQNQKFEEARKWFHYIFDPTKSANDDSSAKRFWITKPFRKEIEQGIMRLEDLLNLEENADELESQLANWTANPFNPHAVARLRISAYMRNTVLRYIDNLIQWGDQLFKRNTIESINEATLLYILASNILGKKQQTVPARAKPVEQSFSDIKNKLDPFSNVKAEIESFISPSSGNDNILMPYFCLPKNEYLLKYWDTVSDRLFKIRHCMNIEGVVRQLPLFEPPIDPTLLVRATAAGLNLNEILDDMNVSLPTYRFQVMLQQANELCNDVKSLGSSLLSALEKKDGEEMALLRSAHELRMLEMIKDVKEKQMDESKENLNSLNASKIVIEERQNYYSSREFMNIGEALYLQSSYLGLAMQTVSSEAKALATSIHITPDIKMGSGFTIGITTGGSTAGASADSAAETLSLIGFINSAAGLIANTMGGYQRRMDDWKFQAKSAELELKQIDKQIISAEIRLAIAEKEIENHSLQMEQSKEVDDYMRSKFTNAELYDWMVGQLSTVYFQSYQLAYSTAKKAEKCMQYELGLQSTSYVQFGYWDSLKKGLLSGEKLQYDLRRLENAYLEENKREYEIVKHVSLAMLDPLALIKLRSTGICDFEIPEALYDMDHSGHYFRRIKSVSVSLPCIAGPYTSVSATLRLTKSQCRLKDSLSIDDLKEMGKGQSIATSNAQNDSGVFELNFRDERYLPFEGCGAISTWQLELPSIVKQFDYYTISDVIIHVKYTAREGNTDFKKQVNSTLIERLNEVKQQLDEQHGMHMALNMKHDLSNEWHHLKTTGSANLQISASRLPYIAQSLATGIEHIIFIARIKDNPANFEIKLKDETENRRLAKIIHEGNDWGLCKTDNITGISLGESFKLSVALEQLNEIEELIMIVKFSF